MRRKCSFLNKNFQITVCYKQLIFLTVVTHLETKLHCGKTLIVWLFLFVLFFLFFCCFFLFLFLTLDYKKSDKMYITSCLRCKISPIRITFTQNQLTILKSFVFCFVLIFVNQNQQFKNALHIHILNCNYDNICEKNLLNIVI